MKTLVNQSKFLYDYLLECKSDSECAFTDDEYWSIIHGFALALIGLVQSVTKNDDITHDDIQNILEEVIMLDDDDDLESNIEDIWTQYIDI
jgi:hypothetical protein